MQGVLGLAVELRTFGSPRGLQIPNFSKCWALPPHLAKVGLRQYTIQYVLPNNIVLLVTIEKFETNHVLVNVNKIKPYKYMESNV